MSLQRDLIGAFRQFLVHIKDQAHEKYHLVQHEGALFVVLEKDKLSQLAKDFVDYIAFNTKINLSIIRNVNQVSFFKKYILDELAIQEARIKSRGILGVLLNLDVKELDLEEATEIQKKPRILGRLNAPEVTKAHLVEFLGDNNRRGYAKMRTTHGYYMITEHGYTRFKERLSKVSNGVSDNESPFQILLRIHGLLEDSKEVSRRKTVSFWNKHGRLGAYRYSHEWIFVMEGDVIVTMYHAPNALTDGSFSA